MMKPSILIAAIATIALSCSTTKPTTPFVKQSFELQGHRGCRGLMPENTIDAMIKAIDLGVTTLEMDLHVSKDNYVVVSHDPYFNENITTTPEGKYLEKGEGPKRLLYQMNYDSIMKYDVGMKPHPDFPHQQKIEAFKPMLVELLYATESYAKEKGKSMLYNIEIKSKPAGDGKKHPPVETFVDLAMDAINAEGITERTTIQSFDPRALKVMHRKYPTVSTSLLIEGDDKRTLSEQLKELGFTPNIYSPHYSLVTPELLKTCHDKNIRVIPWTVNKLEDMKRLKEMGVDGLISDYPDLYSKL